jgi:DNA-directed RNA polymerase specialized sigma24 family protein
VNLAAQPQPASEPQPVDFLAIYNAQGAYVRRTLQRMGVPDRHLDDAMQDVFVVVLRRLPEYQDVDRLTGWLAAIAHNVAAKHCEQEVARPIVADPATVELLFDPEHPETAIGKRDLVCWLLAQIKDPTRRTV